MFCPKCKSLLVSSGGELICRKCGYSRDISGDKSMKKVSQRQEKEITIVDDTEEISTLPTIHVRCPECGHNTAEWWLRQLRSADESEVRFFRCRKCKHTWREYD